MDVKEFAGLLGQVADTVTDPPTSTMSVPPSSNPILIKNALEVVATGGVKVLQHALGVTPDGVFGNQTKTALANIDVNILLDSLPVDLTFANLAPVYRDMYSRSTILPEHKAETSDIANKIMSNQGQYILVNEATGVPEHVIGIIHSLECNLSFSRHLHNGDPLSARTVNVPVGRPPTGHPPFAWVDSAIDAMRYDKLDQWKDWSPEGIAYILERYNGFGYRLNHPEVQSPYLWSYTSIYTKGKFASDGHFDPNLVSQQCGGMTILKELTQWT